ncbi:MAG: TatD family nuclease-associated radical SAM protein [Acidiferrobacterales bacterium]
MADKSRQIISHIANGDCYLNITNRCTLQCNCSPKCPDGWRTLTRDIQSYREPSVREMLTAVGDPLKWNHVVFSGHGEPTQRLYELLEVSRQVCNLGGKVRLETDGLASLFFARDVAPDLEDNIDTLVVALKAQDSATYNMICRPTIDRAHDAIVGFIRCAREFVPNVIVTAMVDTEGVDLEACQRLAKKLGVKFDSRLPAHNN